MATIDKKGKIKSDKNPSQSKIKLKSADEVSEFAENIINTVREPLIALDKNLRVVKASRSFYEFFKVTPGETIGTLIYNLGNRQWNIPKLRELLETILPEKTTFDNYEVEHDFTTIGKRIMLLNARKIQRGLGKEQIILLAIEDITKRKEKERKVLEAEIRESEERFRMVFENVFDGISIYTEDTDPYKRKLVECNEQYAILAGRSREELLRLGSTQGLQLTLEDAANDIRLESLNKGIAYQGSFSWIRPDGKENVIEYVGKPITWMGKAHTIGIDRDVTDRFKLLENLTKFSTAVNQSPVSIVITDIKGNIEYVNPKFTKLTGYTIDEVLNKNPGILKSGEQTQEFYKNLWDTLLSGKVWSGILHNKKKNGELFWESAIMSPVKNEAGEITHFVSVNEDITARKNEEKALVNSELRYRRLFEAAKDGILILNAQTGIIEDSNPYITEILGYSKDQIIGNHLWELGFLKDKAASKINFKELQKQEYISYENLPFENINGEVVYVEFVSNVYFVNEHKVIQCDIRNITKRKIAEDRQVFVTKILSILNRPNEWQKIINDILSEIQIFTDLEAITIRLKEGEDFPNFNIEGLSADFVEKERALCSGNIIGEMSYDSNGKQLLNCLCGDILFKRTDPSLPFFTTGGSFWTNSITELLAADTEKKLQPTISNCFNNEGFESVALIPIESGEKVIGLLQINDKRTGRFTPDMIQFFEKVGSTIGIAFKRMQYEKEIRESEERYKFIVEATEDVIYRLKFDSMKYDYINPAIEKLTGYPPEEINKIGFKNIVSKISKYHTEKVNIDLFVKDMEQDRIAEWQADYQVKTKDGKLIWLSDRSFPWKDETGKVIGSKGILSDITERRQAEEEIINAKESAEEMSRLKSSFLDNMSHELRTPLIGILGFAEVLKDELTDENLKNHAEIIFESGIRLKNTLNQILDLTKIEAENFKMNFEEIELTSYISNLVKVFEKSAETNGIELKVITGDELLFSYLDKSQLNSIIDNLINNAVKFTEKGYVKIELKKTTDSEGGNVEILIEDTGIGIAEENLAIIFEPFRQVSEGLNRKFQGSGLGLTLVKKYVEKMNGTVTVESKIGAGSTFRIRFPITKSEIKKAVGSESKKIAVESWVSKKPSVLFVEDDIFNQKLIKTITGKIYDIEFTEQGEDAIKMAGKKKYDIILMDINLIGRLNGFETTHEIKKIKGYEKTPIIAVTAHAKIGDKEKILLEGLTHYISKPFLKSEFLSLLNEALIAIPSP